MTEVSDILKDVKEGLVVRPGDLLVLTFGRRLHDAEAHEMIDRLQEVLTGVKIVLLPEVDKVTLIPQVHGPGCCHEIR